MLNRAHHCFHFLGFSLVLWNMCHAEILFHRIISEHLLTSSACNDDNPFNISLQFAGNKYRKPGGVYAV